jgi:hypothetical protein
MILPPHFRLLGNRVLLEPERRERLANGIWVAQRWTPTAVARVLAVGSSVVVDGLIPGARVFFRPGAGFQFEWDERPDTRHLRLVEPRDIYGLLPADLEVQSGYRVTEL